ncbi:acyl carrier protein [Paenibacillus sp. GCM10027628]|uniref:acyl carrier protein n=1 Tax=Paenibacillus sp. GCM10027628 TaxID=3273413 RepID=UPI0036414703
MHRTMEEQDIDRKVIGILSAISRREEETIHFNDSLIDDLGVDSIRFLEILAEIEAMFHFELEIDDLRPELFRTVQSVIYFVKNRVTAK